MFAAAPACRCMFVITAGHLVEHSKGTALIITPRYVSAANGNQSATSFSQAELREIVAIWRSGG
jgi:hypothetical protein